MEREHGPQNTPNTLYYNCCQHGRSAPKLQMYVATQWKLTNLVSKILFQDILFLLLAHLVSHICNSTNHVMKLCSLIWKSITSNIEPNWTNYFHKNLGVTVGLLLQLNLTWGSQNKITTIFLANQWCVFIVLTEPTKVLFSCQKFLIMLIQVMPEINTAIQIMLCPWKSPMFTGKLY